MNITFLGAAHEVTGSCTLVQTDKYKILVDCGMEQGKDIYLSIRKNPRSIPVLKADLRQKYAWYCEIIFSRSDYSEEYPKDLPDFLLGVREKLNSLNSLRYALLKQYGKEKGRRFYYLLKPYAKTMYQM